MNTGCILMAAGASTRFGGNKLLAPFCGVPLYKLALGAIPSALLSGVAVVSGADEILSAAVQQGFTPVVNRLPEEGVSRSIRLGIQSFSTPPDALLFMVADQPCLKQSTVEGLLVFSSEQPDKIVRLRCAGKAGNPVIFPSALFFELLTLKGDHGGSAVMKKHPELVCFLEIDDPLELIDADRRESLLQLESDLPYSGLKNSESE